MTGSGLVGWWPLHDDSAQDYSGNGNHGSASNVTFGVSGTQGIESASFNGSSSSIDCATDVVDETEPHTVSLWTYLRDNNSGMWFGTDRSNTDPRGFQFKAFNGSFQLFNGNSGYNGSTTIPTGELIHVSFTFDGNDRFAFYLNGIQQETWNANPASESGNTPFIGARVGNTGSFLDGLISDVRFYQRALSPQEIALLYEQGAQAAPPVDGVARYEFEGDVTDSFNDNDGSNNGASFVDGYYGEAANFNANESDYISCGDVAGGLSGITVSSWVNVDSLSSDLQVIAKKDDGDFKRDWNLRLRDAGSIGFQVDGDNTSAVEYGNVATGSWVLVSATWDGNKITIYQNGEVAGIKSLPTNMPDSSEPVEIGGRSQGGFNYFDGKIDDLRIYPYALSSQQISALYNNWSDLTRPTTDGLVAHYKLDGDATDSAGSNDGANNGVTFERGVRGQGGNFDGSSHISTQASTDSNSLTICGWSKVRSIDDGLIIQAQSSSNEFAFGLWADSGTSTLSTNIKNNNDTDYKLEGNYDIAQETWIFTATIFDDSNKARHYVNGTEVGNISVSGRATDIVELDLGHQSNNGTRNFDGKIDDVRIYNRALSPAEIHELYRYGTRGRDLREKLVNA